MAIDAMLMRATRDQTTQDGQSRARTENIELHLWVRETRLVVSSSDSTHHPDFEIRERSLTGADISNWPHLRIQRFLLRNEATTARGRRSERTRTNMVGLGGSARLTGAAFGASRLEGGTYAITGFVGLCPRAEAREADYARLLMILCTFRNQNRLRFDAP